MSVNSNLFPPIVKDVQPAFIRTGNCNIYFSLSPYNSLSEIAHAQVVLINQKNNQTAFKPQVWRLGIKFVPKSDIHQNLLIANDYKYYITLDNSQIIGNSFELDRFYKVQIRFSDTNTNPGNPDAGWINNNIDHFSEWSSVCLIRGIDQPHISINTLDETGRTSFLIPPTSFVGKMYYSQGSQEVETLKSYNIVIQRDSDNSIIIKSDEVYTNQYNPNEFNYQLKYDFERQVNYTLLFTYTTINLYQATVSFQFKILEQAENELHAIIDITPEEQRGSMKISIAFKPMFNTNKTLMIKRTTSKSNFLEWENIKQLQHNKDIQHLWYDTTIESGVWYKYRIQEYKDQAGGLVTNGRITSAADPVMCVFDDIFLTREDTQLKVQFNPNVSDLKYNVNESQQVTLGAQFPFVRRNGNNYYKSFSIGGLVSSLSEEMSWYDPGYNEDGNYFYYKNVAEPFTSKEEVYGAATELYDGYNGVNNITQYQDYIYQREFRQKVMDFLYKNNVKLFRSLTEGNILVKLTNITLSPISTLGRMLYSFSASATEIAEYNKQNLDKYNIINKFYYTYAILTIEDTFEGERSLIERFYQELPLLQTSNTDIMQLDFEYDGPEDIIVYAKPKNNKIFIRHTLQDGALTLKYSDADPIADSYFWGIHLDSDDYIETNQHYYSTEDVQDPKNYYVYYIVDEYVYLIDNYVQYYNEEGILATYPEEVVPNNIEPNEHSLLVEPLYYKMIYYDGEWYPFSENQDIMLRQLDAIITYTYRTKKGE